MNTSSAADTAAARLGQRLRAARRASGLTLQQLADLAQVSIPTVSSAENGTRQPRLDTLQKLATALGMSMGALLTDPPAPRQQSSTTTDPGSHPDAGAGPDTALGTDNTTSRGEP